MPRIRTLAVLPAVLWLAGCAGHPTDPAAPPIADACNAEAAQAWIGKPATDANLDAVRAATGARSLRALKPGDAMTMDYRADRVNVVQDADGAIEKISCG